MNETEEIINIHTTDELFRLIQSSPQLFFDDEPFSIQHSSAELFSNYLKELIFEAGISTHELIVKSTLGKSHVYLVLSGERNPGRDVIIILALALGLDLPKTQKLLKLGQKSSLYPKVRRDAAIICCIEQKLSLSDTNDFLISVSEEALL